MPLLTTDPPYRGIIHYEVYGRGRPVLFLHGWLGSWQLWRSTVEHVGTNFRAYSLDFWGFGDSRGAGARDETVQEFSIDAFVDMVGQFMDKLGIPKAAIIGHSMGGTVAMASALRYPDRLVKAVAVGSPIDGDSLYLLLKAGGVPALAGLGFTFVPVLRGIISTYLRFSAKDGKYVQDMMMKDFSQTTMQSFFQSINSLWNTDLTDQLGTLQQPLMGIYGKKDIIVGHKQGYLMQELLPQSRMEMYGDAGHFPMLDCPERFISDISSFLETRS